MISLEVIFPIFYLTFVIPSHDCSNSVWALSCRNDLWSGQVCKFIETCQMTLWIPLNTTTVWGHCRRLRRYYSNDWPPFFFPYQECEFLNCSSWHVPLHPIDYYVMNCDCLPETYMCSHIGSCWWSLTTHSFFNFSAAKSLECNKLQQKN